MSPHTIITVADSDKHFAFCVAEYTKRLGKDCQIVTLKPKRYDHHDKIIQEETDLIIKTLERYQGAYTIACSREGKMVDTMEIVQIITWHSHCVWIVGGAFGYDEYRINQAVDYKVAFWSITLQHTMTKLILLEQIYRSQMIIQGRSYHY